MECAECGVRSSVGYCHECEILLCEVCGNECERCHKTVCRSHIQKTSSGRAICVNCVVDHYDSRAKQSKELREKRASRAELGRKKRKGTSESKSTAPRAKSRERSGGKSKRDSKSAPKEDLSFASLTQDEEPLSVPIPDYSPPEPEGADDGGMPLYDKEALNKRVLTGSARRRNPAGISGLFLGIVSWVVLSFAYRATEMGGQRGILILIAFILAAGTVVWTGSHAFSKEPGANRLAARAGLLVGGSAFLLTVMIYVMRGLNA